MATRGGGAAMAFAAAVGLACCVDLGEALAVGTDHACVLLDDATVKCFGQNNYGQLGLGDTDDRGQSAGTMGDSLTAVDLGTGATVVAMSAGSDHTCAVLADGSLKCFGRNNMGQLGLDDTDDRGDEAFEMGDDLPAVSLGTNRTAVAVSAQGDRTCVLLDNGNVRCWGDAEYGALGGGDETTTGNGDGTIADSVDLGVNGTNTVGAIGGGPCAVFQDGSLKCWGEGFYGQNGQGTADSLGDEPGEMGESLPTVPLGEGVLVESISGGRDYQCAVLQDGGLKCWGRAEGGQLGSEAILTVGDDPDEMGDALPTVDLGSAETAVEVSTASSHTCALLGSGGVKCWGKAFFGNLGLEDFRANVALSVAAAGQRTCAILEGGSLKCWGENSGGQLGLEDSDPRGVSAGQMGDSLPAVNLGTNRTAVALARTVVSTAAAATAAPTQAPTTAPTTLPPVVAATSQPVSTPSPTLAAALPTPSPVAPPTPAPVVPVTTPPTPSPTAAIAVEAEEDTDRGGVAGAIDGMDKTVVVAVAAPVGVMLLLGCLVCAAKRKKRRCAETASASRKGEASSSEASLGSNSDEGGV
ncbi:domain repeat protein [Ectocarpus siliculosus]|uniref:Domain repeat protein n=1 Tax=Ectocarpus siliculosus TaxID=2880 RepID=D8LGR4_ECTSI|nr:domain repeat protein [Ectocarpus siliculosus]|eukprot:CBN79084.1 domain repeat protein [Ectocarpus siliculosus]